MRNIDLPAKIYKIGFLDRANQPMGLIIILSNSHISTKLHNIER